MSGFVVLVGGGFLHRILEVSYGRDWCIFRKIQLKWVSFEAADDSCQELPSSQTVDVSFASLSISKNSCQTTDWYLFKAKERSLKEKTFQKKIEFKGNWTICLSICHQNFRWLSLANKPKASKASSKEVGSKKGSTPALYFSSWTEPAWIYSSGESVRKESDRVREWESQGVRESGRESQRVKESGNERVGSERVREWESEKVREWESEIIRKGESEVDRKEGSDRVRESQRVRERESERAREWENESDRVSERDN